MALTNGQRAKTSYKNGTYIQTKKTHGFDVTKLMDLTYGQRAKTSYKNGKYIQTTLRKQNSWLWRNKTKQLWQTEPKYGNAITEPKYGGTRYEGNKKYIYIYIYHDVQDSKLLTSILFLSKHGKTLSIFSGSSSFNPIVLFVFYSKQVTIATYSFISILLCNFIFVGSSKSWINFLLLMQGTNLVAFNR